jgi:hypothetical protein
MQRVRAVVVAGALTGCVLFAFPPSPARADPGLGFDENSQPGFEDWTPVTLRGTAQLASMTISPFTVEDSRLVADGWHVDLTITNLVWDDPDVGDPDFTIFADDMTMNAPTVTPIAPATMTDVTVTPDVATFGDGAGGAVAQTIVSAAVGAGLGFYMVSLEPVKVTVPADAIAATYEGNAIVDVISGP